MDLKMEYYGHSCFRLTAREGTRILMDPYEGVGYAMPKAEADLVLCSHGHFDHHFRNGVAGTPEWIEAPGRYRRGEVEIQGIASFHDDVRGAKRGRNVIFVVDSGVRVCHMGDIGEPPSARLLAQIGKVDILLIPVGGTYTVDAAGALEYIDAIGPQVTVAMHYCCEGCTLDIASTDALLAAAGAERCIYLHGSEFEWPVAAAWKGKILIAERKGSCKKPNC